MNNITYDTEDYFHWKCGKYKDDTLQGLFEILTRKGFYYPYHSNDETENWESHAHTWDGLMVALLNDADNGFSIKGLEEYYSKQEIEFIEAVLEAHRNGLWESKESKRED